MSKHILIIGYVWPEPCSSAAGSRMLQLIDVFLEQSWRVVFASPANLSEHRFDLTTWGVEEKIISLNCSSFDEYIAQLQPAMVMFDRFFTEEQFGWRVAQTCPDALRLLNTEDLHSLRHARQQRLKSQQKQCATELERYQLGPVLDDMQSLYPAMAADDMAQREIAAIYRCDISLLISDFEMALLQQVFLVPGYLLHYCPFMLPPPSVSQPGFDQRQDFITLGNFRHEPNWDAVLWLKHAIWPRIRAHLPGAQLKIYGAYPPPKATALHNPKQGFQVQGWAEDAHQVMAQARVCLAPLRFGAGIKGKLIDAMLCGTPSVTTSLGAEAMSGELPWPGAVADDLEGFVAAAVDLYQHPENWHRAQRSGEDILRERFAQAVGVAHLLQKLEDVAGDLTRHRQRNFTGAMLQHHQHKSTQYMSQWIEEKNKKANP